MPSVKNETKLAQIEEDLEVPGAVWVVDACGLTVKETQALRQAVREAGASMKVYKNTLMHIALADAELPTLDDILHGPSAFVFAGDDVAAAAKAVKAFSKTNDTLEIKGGLMEGAAVSAAEVEAIASLPSREELCFYCCCYRLVLLRVLLPTINGAPWSGSGHQGRCRSEGSCVSGFLAA